MPKAETDITIKGDCNSCVTHDLPLSLGSFNVFAGENNSGKTTLIKKIINHPDIIRKFEVIHIPATEITPENSLKTSVKSSSFYKSIQLILKPLFDNTIIEGLVKGFDKSPEKREFIAEVNKIIQSYGEEKTKFDITIPYENFESDLIVKIAKAITHDKYDTEADIVDISDIGMGTQRLLAMALLQYYSQQTRKPDKPPLIVVEEPEIYLHPMYKEKFFNTLKELSEKESACIVITTHDSFFIDLCVEQNIYRVERDHGKSDCTKLNKVDIDKNILSYPSSALINYFIFKIYSKTLYIELYERLKSLKFPTQNSYTDIDNYIHTELGIPQDQSKDPGCGTDNITITTRLRHDLAHPTKEKLERFDLHSKEQTDNLINLIQKNI